MQRRTLTKSSPWPAVWRAALAALALAVVSAPVFSTSLVNLSTRGFVGSDADRMLAGLVVNGPSTKEFLVFALGPTLSASGVPGVIPDPKLTLQKTSGEVVASNDDWGDHPTAPLVGALLSTIGITLDDKEAALIIELPAGDYTALVEGSGGENGVALAGIIDLDEDDTFNTGPCDGEIVEIELPLVNTGVIAGANGNARLRHRADCSQDFRVEIKDVPLGDYGLFVGGDQKGTITVIDTGTENEGEIEFETDPDLNELPLTFDPAGQLIEVKQGDTVILNLQFPSI
ncbi:MAG: hypothetical protein U9Q81_25775 [Pseudomonadota bacterium]|nr:hypothetical protein [Pseudomonadota bacterium]